MMDEIVLPPIDASSEDIARAMSGCKPNQIIGGDTQTILPNLPTASVDLSFWSPPYYVGKSYE